MVSTRDRSRPRRRSPKSFRRPPQSSQSSQPPLQAPRLRLLLVWGLLLFAMVGLTVKLAQLQLEQGPELHARAQEQQKIYRVPRAARRPIEDSQGNVVAVDRMVYTLFVHPIMFDQPLSEIARQLSEQIEVEPTALIEQFGQQETGIRVASNLSEEVAKRIRGLQLNGLDLLPTQQRRYPHQDLLAQIVGYIDFDGTAQAGLEYGYQDQLLYEEPGQTPNLAGLPPAVVKDDQSLQLTIDSRLQRVAQRNLASTLAQHGAKRGTVLVMDSDSGEILAMAVLPTYDPNRYYDADVEQFKNWAVSDLYEPGSTFKPINVAIALEAGAIKVDDQIYDEGRIPYEGWTIQNSDFSVAGGHGTISITDVLRYSSNVGMVHIMEGVDREAYYNALEALGLGQETGIDLPAETAGQLKDRSEFVSKGIEAATTAFGQGFSLTPIQMIQLQATLANGGKLVTPHVVRGLVNQAGELTWQPQRPAPKQVFDPSVSQQVLAMMEAVVDDGTGKPAKISGYRIAGKTGTAQKANEFGQYGNQRITSFVSIVPVNDPHYVVLAVIDEPQGDNAYGSTVAAPLVKSVLESLLVFERVPPQGS